jgi:hypothetical protein
VLDILLALVSELLAASSILVLLTFVPGPKYMSNETKSRRRFLSGSAAAPFIMTVQPGSVLAASSTSCFTNGGKQPDPILLPDPATTGQFAPDPDFWYRERVELVTLTNRTTGQLLDGEYISPLSKVLNPGSNYFKFVSDSSAPLATIYVVGAPDLEVKPTGKFKQALVMVNSKGELVGFQWETHLGGTKITKSCYASFIKP